MRRRRRVKIVFFFLSETSAKTRPREECLATLLSRFVLGACPLPAPPTHTRAAHTLPPPPLVSRRSRSRSPGASQRTPSPPPPPPRPSPCARGAPLFLLPTRSGRHSSTPPPSHSSHRMSTRGRAERAAAPGVAAVERVRAWALRWGEAPHAAKGRPLRVLRWEPTGRGVWVWVRVGVFLCFRSSTSPPLHPTPPHRRDCGRARHPALPQPDPCRRPVPAPARRARGRAAARHDSGRWRRRGRGRGRRQRRGRGRHE